MLPAEAAEREIVSRRFAQTCSAWGYDLVETPIVEDLVSLEAAAGSLEGIAFRLVDSDGRLLALRPDMTVPIARLVASRLTGDTGARRFRYAAEVFREHESLRGQMRGFCQLGVELVGESGPAADAEVVAVLAEGLEAVGIREFTVSVGTVAVLHAIVAAAGEDDAWSAAVLEAAHNRNLVGLDQLARSARNAAVAEALRVVPRIHGGAEAIDACRDATGGLGCDAVLEDLAATWEILVAAGVSERVVVDFSVMRSFDYYTGLVVEAFAPGLGLPLGGGGRYDGVLASYDSPLPAAGFALGLERVMIALVEQGVEVPVAPLDAVVGGEPVAAIREAAALRAAGKRVALSTSSGAQLRAEASRLGAVEALEAGAWGLTAVTPAEKDPTATQGGAS